MNTPTYIPGVCNIGEKEISRRKMIGWIGLIVIIFLGVLFYIYGVSFYVKLLIFFPATLSATGFIQAYKHFCAGFGMKGIFNFSSELNKTDSVSQAVFRAQDRREALSILLQSVLIGAVVTILFIFLPLLLQFS